MSAYDHLPPIKPPRSMAWYSQVSAPRDDALEEGLALLETLRAALTPDKSYAVDEARRLLIEAAELYRQASSTTEQIHTDPSALAKLLPPEKKQLLLQLCEVLRQGDS